MKNSLFVSSGYSEISPDKIVNLSGFIKRKDPFTSQSDPLEINVLLIKCELRKIILISTDLLYVTDEIKNKILNNIEPKYGFDKDSLFIASSHTHFAPGVDPAKSRLGTVDSEYIEYFIKKTNLLIHKVILQKPEKVNLKFCIGQANHSVNRRLKGWILKRGRIPKRGVRFAPNKEGHNDESIDSLIFEGLNKKIVCVLWSYACHPTCFPDLLAVSSDYPGVVRREIRRKFKNKIPVLFFQGFSGNIRPFIVKKPKNIKERIKRKNNRKT